jgi:hypothetical protein
VPVFAKSASASENSLIGSGRSLSVENNYGYQGPVRPPHRCDHTARLRADGHQQARQRLRAVWTNHTESAPAWVPKLSTTNSPGPHARGFRIWREAVTASAPRRQSGVAAPGRTRPRRRRRDEYAREPEGRCRPAVPRSCANRQLRVDPRPRRPALHP